MKNTKSKCIAGVVLLAIVLLMTVVLNSPTFSEEKVSFLSQYNDKEVVLKGSYWEAEGAEYAVLICPGYSCDRQKWRPMADLCVANGLTTMTFDYSGQGASKGTIGFDNAKTDRIPIQIADAIEELHRRSGIDYEHIILMGHSMGGRSILRLLYDYNDENAKTTITRRPIGNVLLLSPEVNYNYNAQASLFAGTSDATEEPWKSYSEENTVGCNVYLFGSTADDIVSDEDVLAIYQHLGGTNAPKSGKTSAEQTNAVGSTVSVNVIGGVLHSYQMYSARFGKMINTALTEITGQTCSYPTYRFGFVYGSWFLGLLGLFLILNGLNRLRTRELQESIPTLDDAGRYLRRKALMWLPGTVAAVLICCLCVCMPFGSPVMNTPYMCFIAGYGLVMLWAYRRGKFPGTEGKLPRLTLQIRGEKKEWLRCGLVFAGLCFFVWYVLRASMYRLIPLNYRIFWVLFATVLMTVGYYISGVEGDMLAAAGTRTRVIYNLIQYVPLFLLVGFYLVLKSYSGMIGQAQNMVFMYIFCIPLGNLICKVLRNRFLGAVATAFLFQTFMITSAALISMF